MLRRKIYDYMLNWKENRKNECLIIKGARQVGKTFIIEEFGKTFNHFFEVNFLLHPELKDIFKGSLDVDDIMMRLSMFFPNAEFGESTLIFLDEIQHCPNGRTSLKFLAEDERFDVIASGSLLGLNHSEEESFPVGYIETMELFPLDFEEFLWAMGIGEDIIRYLRDCYENRKSVENFIHEIMLKYFTTYMVTGGMPAVVQDYAKYKDYASVLHIQRDIIAGYKKDVVKYAEDNEKARILRTFDSIPSQLSKANKKFQYSVIGQGSRSREYGTALLWLKDAGIISFCKNLSSLQVPLSGFVIGDEFKTYMNDAGLLVSMFEDGTAMKIMQGELGLFKGAFYENVIATSLLALGHRLFYFSPSDTLEIDFIINYKGAPCLLEVKSGENTKSKSLNAVLNNPKYKVNQAIRLSRKNVGEEGKILSLPLYMIMFLKDETDNSWESNLPDPEKMFETNSI